jgi:hypothetical protein
MDISDGSYPYTNKEAFLFPASDEPAQTERYKPY